MSWRELGELCAEFKRKDPRFTGRPIESVTQKLLSESADFDVPEEWFECAITKKEVGTTEQLSSDSTARASQGFDATAIRLMRSGILI